MTFVLSLGIALISAIVGLILKAQSRPSAGSGKYWWHNGKREDFVFWSDWVVAGAVAAISFVLKETLAGNHFEAMKFIPTLFILVCVPLFVPSLLGALLYDPAGALRPGYRRILGANAIGLAILVGLVFGGAHVG